MRSVEAKAEETVCASSEVRLWQRQWEVSRRLGDVQRRIEEV